MKIIVHILSAILTLSFFAAIAYILFYAEPQTLVKDTPRIKSFEVPESTLEKVVIDPDQLNCLAMNIYHESRGEEIEGQIAVGHVTVNRMEHTYWPDTICDVVYQPRQFSWTFTIINPTPNNTNAWQEAMFVAELVMRDKTIDPTNGATFYHAKRVSPSWARQMDVSTIIGLHIFYVWDGTWD
jgi:N-acetylmuramoyl-L-alanine amidase